LSILAPNPYRPKTAAQLFAPLSVRLGLTTLEFHASPHWGSNTADHRELLREALETRIKELGCVLTQKNPYPVSAPADLSTASAEIARSISISISHAKSVGGFALLSSHEGSIGFDIEDIGRVTDAVAKRISAPGEQKPESLESDLFWAAKEAAFKALRGPRQPAVLSDFGLAFNQIDESTHFFEIAIPSKIQGLGLTLAEKSHALSVFVLKSST